jgi:hypothetical protein
VCAFTPGSSTDAIHLGGKCASSNPCVGLNEALCGEITNCKAATTADGLFARCVTSILSIDDTTDNTGDETPCFAYTSQSNCAAGECAWVSTTVNECCDDGICFQVPDADNCDTNKPGTTYAQRKKDSCSSKCKAAGANSNACEAADTCCFVESDSGSGQCYDLDPKGKCPVETEADLEQPVDSNGVPTGSNTGGTGCFAANVTDNKPNCLAEVDEESGLQSCMWVDNPYTECLGPRITCNGLGKTRCANAEACTVKVTDYGFCTDSSACRGKDKAACDTVEGCDFLFGICVAASNMRDLEMLASNGTCAFDVHRVESYRGDVPCGANSIFNASLADDGLSCNRQLDIDGNIRCMWVKPLAADMVCMNTSSTGADECGSLQSKAFCEKPADDSSFDGIECVWAAKQYADDRSFVGAVGVGNVCMDKQYTQAEICGRFNNDYSCEATAGCAFEEKADLAASSLAGFLDLLAGDDPLDSELEVEVPSGQFALSFCQGLVESVDQCEAPKKKGCDGADDCNICMFVEVETVVCRLNPTVFVSNTTDFANLPKCSNVGKEDCLKLTGCVHETITQGRCAPAASKCTRFAKQECLADAACLYHPPGKGVCQEKRLREDQAGNLTKAEDEIRSKCRCLADDSNLHYNAESCENAGCAFYTREQSEISSLESEEATSGGDGGAGGGDITGGTGNVAEAEPQAACTERPASSKSQTFGGEGGLDEPDFCTCFNDPDACTPEETEAVADGQDAVVDCSSISAQQACISKQTDALKRACDWYVPVQKHACSGGTGCSEDPNDTLFHPVTGELNQTECLLREGCEVKELDVGSGSCQAHNPCAVHNGRQADCAQAQGCAYDAGLGNCAVTMVDRSEPCKDASCCFNFADDKSNCNRAKLESGARACLYLEKSNSKAPSGYCGPASPGDLCNATELAKEWLPGSEKAECNAADGCAWDDDADVGSSCERYNPCVEGTLETKNEATCHAVLDGDNKQICKWYEGRVSEDQVTAGEAGEGACFLISDIGGDVGDTPDDITQEEVEDGILAGSQGSGLGVACMLFTTTEKCKSAQNSDGTAACMFLEGYCLAYDRCRTDGANKNRILCTQADCSWEPADMDVTGREGTCKQKPAVINSGTGASYTCVAAVTDVATLADSDKVEGTLTAGTTKNDDFKPKPPQPISGCCVLTEGVNPSKITCVDNNELVCTNVNSELLTRGLLENEIMHASFKPTKRCAELRTCTDLVSTKATTKTTKPTTPAPPPVTVNPLTSIRLFLSFTRGQQNLAVRVFPGQSAYIKIAILAAAEGLFGLSTRTPSTLAAAAISFRGGGVQINFDAIPTQYLPGRAALDISVAAINQNSPQKLGGIFLKVYADESNPELAATQLRLARVEVYSSTAQGIAVPTAPNTEAPLTAAPPSPTPQRVTVPKEFTKPSEDLTTLAPTTITEPPTTAEPTTRDPNAPSTAEPTTQKQRFVAAGGLSKVDDKTINDKVGDLGVSNTRVNSNSKSSGDTKKVNPSTVAVVGVLMFLILCAGVLVIYHMKKKMDTVASDPNYVRGMGQVYGNPAYNPAYASGPAGGAGSEADEGYLDIQEAARRAQQGGGQAAKGKKKGLIRQESLC